jgi:hypothetical protein
MSMKVFSEFLQCISITKRSYFFIVTALLVSMILASSLLANVSPFAVYKAQALQGVGNKEENSNNNNTNLYILDGVSNVIKRYDGLTGAFIGNLTTVSREGACGRLTMAFGPDGNLYVASLNDVKRYNAATGAFIDTFVSGISPTSNSNSSSVCFPLTGGSSRIEFLPDGKIMYVLDNIGNIKRYDAHTGAFIDVIIPASTENRRGPPSDWTIGPDSNIYMGIGSGESFNSTTQMVNFSQAIGRFDGITGKFLGNFTNIEKVSFRVVEHPFNDDYIAFGPDGKLYVVQKAAITFHTTAVLIKRYDGHTGAFIDDFIHNAYEGPLGFSKIVFGPDGNIYTDGLALISTGLGVVSRFDAQTGAPIGTFGMFVSAGSGHLGGISDFAFGPSSTISLPPHFHKLTVKSVDYNNNNISTSGYFITLFGKSASNSRTAITAFTPANFALNAGQHYKVIPARFGNIVFDHWQDNGSKIRVRDVSIDMDAVLTAVYRDVNQPAPTGHSKISVATNTVDPSNGTSSHEIKRYYTTLWQNGTLIADGFSEMSFIVNNNSTYQVAVSDFGGFVFDHWANNGSKDRFYNVTTGNDTLTEVRAVYRAQ